MTRLSRIRRLEGEKFINAKRVFSSSPFTDKSPIYWRVLRMILQKYPAISHRTARLGNGCRYADLKGILSKVVELLWAYRVPDLCKVGETERPPGSGRTEFNLHVTEGYNFEV
jgi:hypothetical protein